ncbi:hypothetical protein Pcac1_g28873 [Phytophthora cactorum]|nr:hypothetical protein Pcac1_g29069 [Phytophthora cactorum]KAG2759068.1 hypothetical protein Pcac1_g28873 [Phytophthora cactorum]
MSRCIAYVVHKVIIYETLTVTRLSNSTSYASYPHRRDESGSCQASHRGVEALCLTRQLIGGGISLSGLTRGERKLLALATALLANLSFIVMAREIAIALRGLQSIVVDDTCAGISPRPLLSLQSSLFCR